MRKALQNLAPPLVNKNVPLSGEIQSQNIIAEKKEISNTEIRDREFFFNYKINLFYEKAEYKPNYTTVKWWASF